MRDISDLRHRFTLEEPVESDDGAGGVIRTWAFLTKVWAAIEHVSGQPEKGEDRMLGSVTHKITIRAREGITRLQRFTWQGRVFHIRYFCDANEARGCFLAIYVEEERP
jgi:SPP1 family predicted phage head-tail adaptor